MKGEEEGEGIKKRGEKAMSDEKGGGVGGDRKEERGAS